MPRRAARPSRRFGRIERWLNLLAYLLDRRTPATREEILTRVEDYRRDWVAGNERVRESVRRKFERDKQALRALGIVIEPARSRVDADHADSDVEAYRLRCRDFYLPYLDLTPGRPRPRLPYSLTRVAISDGDLAILRRAAERVLALGETPLGPSAASALRKLSFDLPDLPDLARQADEVAFAAPVPSSFGRIFPVLREGVERRRAVRCRYYGIARDQEEERVIEPYGLMLSWGLWYCIARSRERDAIRIFRLDRMRTAVVLEEPESAFRVPAAFAVRDYLDRAPWELADAPAVTARVRIAFPHSRWVMAEGLGRVVESVDDAGGGVFEFDVKAADPFIRWLLPFGAQVELLHPADLADRLRAERERIRRLYA